MNRVGWAERREAHRSAGSAVMGFTMFSPSYGIEHGDNLAIDETDAAAGPATFDMANLRPERTGLPFVVFISQGGDARHDVRVKLARSPHVRPSEMITVAVRPVPRVIRGQVSAYEFELVRKWLDLNADVLVDHWNGVIAYTEDVMDALTKLPETERP